MFGDILDILAKIINIFFWFCIALEVLCGILFIFHTFKRTKYFSTAFFQILTIGFAFDGISIAIVFLAGSEINGGMALVVYWYSQLVVGPWNTLLALNRFTAIWFWKRHDSIWTKKLVIFGLIFMFFYPFIASINLLAENAYCCFHPKEFNCAKISNRAQWVATFSNGGHVFASAILGIITASASRCKIISTTAETKKFEDFLLIQAFLSLILYGCHLYYFVFSGLSNKLLDFEEMIHKNDKDQIFGSSSLAKIFSVLANNFYTFFKISSIFLLFFLS